MTKKTILVTGGAGYIGAHTCVQLLETGYDIVVVDDLSNSHRASLERVEQLTGQAFAFHELNMIDKAALRSVFEQHTIDGVIHFAGFKAVGESVAEPMMYYHNNLLSTLNLCELMAEFGVKKLVFSSSATVYGQNNTSPLTESLPLSATNPYGQTKLMIEQILNDLYVSDNTWRLAILRYFNPIGAHRSGDIGEDPNGTPNNLMPYITQVAIGKREKLSVFGNDYDTPDGTGVRDYIHVVDLANGHLKALVKLDDQPGVNVYNLGTGRGYSVFDVIAAFERVNGVKIPYEVVARRSGDIAACYADPDKALRELGWQAEKDIDDMCRDSWRWQQQNPSGYAR